MRLPLLALACLATFQCSAQTSTPQVPISAFVSRDQFYRPNMSPDGKHLAVTVRVPVGKRLVPMLSFYSLPDLKLESTLRLKAFEVPVGYHWASNTRLVVEKGQEFGTRERPMRTGEIMAVEVDGTKQEYIFGYDMFTYSVRRNGYDDDYAYGYVTRVPQPMNNHVLVSSHPWKVERSTLLDIDSRTAIRKERASLPVKGLKFVTQRDGALRFAYGSKEDTDFLLMRYDDASGKWNTLDKAYTGVALYPFAFSDDNSEFMAWQYGAHGPAKLIRERVADGQRKEVAYDPEGDVDLMFGTHGNYPIAAFTTVGRPRTVYLDESKSESQLYSALSQQFPDSIVRFSDFTNDGNLLIFSVYSDRDPGALYLYNRKENKADMLMVSMDGIDPEQMAERRPITFNARDGLKLHGFLTMPKHAPQEKLPLVLIPHGGPHGPYDSWSFDGDAQFLANRGYAVLQVNFRGSGGRGEDFEQAGYRQWGGKIMDDLIDGVKWTINQGEVDGQRVCAFGASFGGYASLMLAAREPQLFKCAVGYSGVYDLALLNEEFENKRNKRYRVWTSKFIGDDKDELTRFSPSRQADKIKAPVLLIHGGKDEIAPKEHAFAMRDALTKAGRPPEWLYVDYEGHGFYDTENATAVYQKLEEFLKKNIGKK